MDETVQTGSENGSLHKGKRFACDSALVYARVIVFGPARILYHDREKKSWLLDRLLAKHGDPSGVFEPGYPLLHQIILCEQRIEILKSPVLRGATLWRTHFILQQHPKSPRGANSLPLKR